MKTALTDAPVQASTTAAVEVPPALRGYVIEQQYSAYSADAHRVWREVLSRNERLIAEYGARMHPAYVEGMQALALPSRIPRTEELNERLGPTGWKVVSVDGYIPSEAYVRLMSSGIFPVSRMIRRFEHIDFAPAPDLVHDVLGHLPMLFSHEYRDFLKGIATVMTRATSNALDTEYYESLRLVTSLRSDPASPAHEVRAAEARLNAVYEAFKHDSSELACLRRMYIWSVEFGLLGTTDQFSIHGSALLSSPTEFRAACNGATPIRPYSMDVIHYENAVSDLLEQYFVARDFAELANVLVTFAYERGLTQRTTAPPMSGARQISPAKWRTNA